MPTPTVRRLQVGHVLRHLRESAGLDLDDAGRIIGKTNSTMSRIERGGTGLAQHLLKKLVQTYASQVDEAVDTEWLLELARGSQERGRWSGYRSVYAKYFRMAVDLEEDAASIRIYHNEIIPGLLQTEDYIRALFTSAQTRLADESTDDAIEARLERQQMLTKKDPPELTFVLSESALRRMIGTPEVMHEQLLHLAKLAQQRNLQLQVLPFRARTAPRASFDFQLFRVPSPGNAGPLEFVYLEEYTDGRYLDEHTDVDAYNGLWSQVAAAALGPVESREFVLRVAAEFI
jgi:transcriptional regulator with XRE-family HTH domain